MKVTREAKLYPNKNQTEVLIQLFEESRLFYNTVLERKIEFYKENGKNIHRFELEKEFKGKRGILLSTVKGSIINRVDKAFLAFFRKNSSFPRFKGRNRFRSIPLRRFGEDFKIKGNYLSTWKIIGKIKMRGFLEGEGYSDGRIVKRATGWYFQCIVNQNFKKTKKIKSSVGIDLGIKSFITDSKKNKVNQPRYSDKSSFELRVKQRSLERKKKGGFRRNKARVILAKTYEKITNQRKDFLHKVSRKYADKYDLVAVENLDIENMMSGRTLSRYIIDSSWNTFINMLSYKMQILGKTLVKVNPAYTTQECSQCGELVKKSLSVRTHICKCGFIADRDYNAALNILKKARTELSARTALSAS